MADQPTQVDEKKFQETLRQMADRARDEVGYHATRFRQMLAERGGFGVAHYLLSRNEVSDGFTNMQLAQRIDLTLECVVQKPEWRRFFSPQELAHAKSLTGNASC